MRRSARFGCRRNGRDDGRDNSRRRPAAARSSVRSAGDLATRGNCRLLESRGSAALWIHAGRSDRPRYRPALEHRVSRDEGRLRRPTRKRRKLAGRVAAYDPRRPLARRRMSAGFAPPTRGRGFGLGSSSRSDGGPASRRAACAVYGRLGGHARFRGHRRQGRPPAVSQSGRPNDAGHRRRRRFRGGTDLRRASRVGQSPDARRGAPHRRTRGRSGSATRPCD